MGMTHHNSHHQLADLRERITTNVGFIDLHGEELCMRNVPDDDTGFRAVFTRTNDINGNIAGQVEMLPPKLQEVVDLIYRVFGIRANTVA